jgi:DNA (cytosine-5)-methyltransferase 1
MRPRLLDLFCGAGGAAMGYHRAGFDVVGVDIKPQPHYPFEFHQSDALEYVAEHGHEFDAIHASPPCQAFTALKSMWNAKPHPDLVDPTRQLLIASGKPYVIENVPGAPLIEAWMLCGTMFGLGTGEAELRRHRLFETTFAMLVPPCSHYQRHLVIGVYGGHGRDHRRTRPATVGVYGDGNGRDYRRQPATVGVYGSAGGASVRDGTQQFSTAERAEAMGIDWMTGNELSQAIPPAYTEFIGEYLLAEVAA